jgi:hypothetical protein
MWFLELLGTGCGSHLSHFLVMLASTVDSSLASVSSFGTPPQKVVKRRDASWMIQVKAWTGPET